MNNLYRESTEITERMSKSWLDNIWKSLLPFKEKNKMKGKKNKKRKTTSIVKIYKIIEKK